ncbi:hypothetical protein [Promineifilum sp.]|uniref:hypothetical protein n=1 Tax=Promineifilum sp. TaxID=2664178 RepID=UPI0035B14FF6
MTERVCPACGAAMDEQATCTVCGWSPAVNGASDVSESLSGDAPVARPAGDDGAPPVPLAALPAPARLALRAAARVHPGRVRGANEDSVLLIQLVGLPIISACSSWPPRLWLYRRRSSHG